MTAIVHKTGLTRLPLRAAGFVALVCVAILGVSGVREWSAREASLKAAEVEMSNLARSLMQHAEDSFDLLDSSIVGLVSRLDADGSGPDILASLKKILVARKAGLKRINYLAIIGENGDWLASSGAMWGNLSDREYFRHHRDSADRTTFIGQPVQSKANNEWITTLSRRFNHADGSFAGLVFGTMSASYFSEFYAQFDIGKNGSLTLLRNDGIIQVRRPDDGTSIGRDVSNSPFFKGIDARGSSEVYRFKSTLDGLERIGAYRRSSRYPFVVVATKAQDEVLAPWRQATIVRMLFVSGLVLLIAAIGLFLVRQLQRGQRMAAALAAKEADFRVLAEGSSDMVMRIGIDERIRYASPSSVRVVGWPPEKLTGTTVLAGVHPEDVPEVEQTIAALKAGDIEEARITYRTSHREKSEIWVESTLRVTRNVGGEIDGLVAITRDMTEQKDIAEKLETLATEDALTGLANRRRFDERLLEEWGRACREKTCLSLLLIDVDHFKTFNDRYGHPAGDRCLRSIAADLTAEAQRATDLAARYGGEEFVLLLPNTDAEGCAQIGEKIRRALFQRGIPHAANPSRHVTLSLGGATFQPTIERSARPSSLVDAADKALYAAKHDGRNRLVMAAEVTPLLLAASAAG